MVFDNATFQRRSNDIDEKVLIPSRAFMVFDRLLIRDIHLGRGESLNTLAGIYGF